jgi:hypothetical protein
MNRTRVVFWVVVLAAVLIVGAGLIVQTMGRISRGPGTPLATVARLRSTCRWPWPCGGPWPRRSAGPMQLLAGTT